MDEGPADNGGVAYAIFTLLGVGILAPYNSMISAVDFFSVLYPGTHIESILSVRLT
jgi:equilibrative nucleoside transporter 1/2/3